MRGGLFVLGVCVSVCKKFSGQQMYFGGGYSLETTTRSVVDSQAECVRMLLGRIDSTQETER